MDKSKLQTVTLQLLSKMREDDYCGYDPFDGLNSKVFAVLPFKHNRFLRLAWLQFHKHSLINFRPICLTPKVRNPKAIALIILGCLNLYKSTKQMQYLTQAEQLADWLLANRCQGWQGACWGYPFDWQARAFYAPKGKPNLIATAYVARALRQLSIYSTEPKYLNTANLAGEFTMAHLLNKNETGTYFSYIPGETALVHNANLWAAVITAAAAVNLNDKNKLALALEAAKYSINAQQANGSWAYGNKPYHQFIDGFHSGYNLEALAELQDILQSDCYQKTIDRGFKFYLEACFLDNGAPKYYANKVYPIDTHSVAQALITLQKISHSNQCKSLQEKIINYALTNLYDQTKKLFYYQQTPYYKNKINYLRWVQAWMFYALSAYEERN